MDKTFGPRGHTVDQLIAGPYKCTSNVGQELAAEVKRLREREREYENHIDDQASKTRAESVMAGISCHAPNT